MRPPEPLSARNPRVQRLRRLSRRRSARSEEGCFVVEGAVSITEALAAGAPVTELYVAAGAVTVEPLLATAASRAVPVHTLSADALERVATTTTPQPVLAVVAMLDRPVADLLATAGRRPVLVLADIADPGNAGTLVRSAAAAGLGGVIAAGSGVDLYNPKTVRASAGSLFRLPVSRDVSLDRVAASLAGAGYRLIGAVARGGAAPDQVDLAEGAAIVVGNEAHGLPAGVHLDARVTIDMAAGVESLNVAMAGTLLCFEARRQRHDDGPVSS